MTYIHRGPIETIKRLTEKFWQVTGVIRVDSITNFQATKAVDDGISVEALFPKDAPVTELRLREAEDYIDGEPLVIGSLITPDKKVAILRAKFAPNAINPQLPAQVYGELTTLLDAEEARTGYQFYLAGGLLLIRPSIRLRSRTLPR